jgi:hypothetical protein
MQTFGILQLINTKHTKTKSAGRAGFVELGAPSHVILISCADRE